MGGVPAGAGSLVGQRLGKYQLLALLALGGTAEIYLARIEGTSGFEKYVVVKCLHDHLADDEEFVHMFLDEARLGAVLDHSNIVQTLELGEHQGRYYMAMEFLAGMSLAMVARKALERVPGARIPVHLVLGIAAQAAAGLHYAHERQSGGQPLNVVHRDISPQNLVVTFEGVVKIVDFGIAKAEYRETKTRSGTIKGKFAYMSPEQCLAKDVDRRTDVFALGTVVHELITGRRLFKKPSAYDTYHAILDGDVPLPSEVNHELDPGLDDVVMKALAYQREDRYPTAEAFGEALIRYLHHRGKHAGAGEVSRYFDQYYQREIDEHATRMRELLEGREAAATSLVTWDGEPGSDIAASGPDDESSVMSIETADVVMESSASASVSSVSESATEPPTNPERERYSQTDLGGEPGGMRGDDDELFVRRPRAGDDDAEGEGERTRIEVNPFGKVVAREQQAEREARHRRDVPTPPVGKPRAASAPAASPPVASPPVASSPAAADEEALTLPPIPHAQGKRRNAPGSSPHLPSPLAAPLPAPPSPPMRLPPPSQIPTVIESMAPTMLRGAAPAQPFESPTVQRPAGFGAAAAAAAAAAPVRPDQVKTAMHTSAPPHEAFLTPPSVSSLAPPPTANPAGAVSNVELPLPAHLIGLPPIEQVFSTSELEAIARERNRKVPPWLLLLLFLAAVGVALGLTIALARALR
jgi:eukaryotic-like serine/threonine-protein kinase